MNIEYLIMALEALRANKIRSLLSMLGIIIGVSTVITVVGIGLGAQEKINEQYKNMSVESIMVMGGGGGPGDRNVRSKLKAEDLDTVLTSAEYVKNGTVIQSGSTSFSYGKDSASYDITGVTEGFFDIIHLNLDAGKMFTTEEFNSKDRIVILGYGIVEEYFENNPEKAIGEIVKINNKQFEVIGTLKENGTSSRMLSYDDAIYTPLTTAEKSVLGSEGRLMIMFLAKDVNSLTLAMEEIRVILREKHKLKSSAEDDFRMFDAGSMVSSAQSSAETMSILLTSVAAIVLIVSGIGIMNVMFVTVAERTKEIGIMKAIGAKQMNILIQFLLESVFLSIIGGLIGIGIGQIIIPFLNKLEGWYVLRSVTGIVVAFTFSVTVGIFFGFYPAFKASRLDPVDALRSE